MERTDRAIVEAAHWTALNSSGGIPLLRSEALRPLASLVGEPGFSESKAKAERAMVVASVIDRRRQLLLAHEARLRIGHGPYRDPVSPMARGRILLCTSATDSLWDGAAQTVSEGFFDDEDLPPSDTWIAYVEGPGAEHLVSWVPFVWLGLVQRAIDQHIVGALMWHPDFPAVLEFA